MAAVAEQVSSVTGLDASNTTDANGQAANEGGDAQILTFSNEQAEISDGTNEKKVEYPLKVLYCSNCTLPGEYHGYESRNQFEKCKPWLGKNCPELFPDIFPQELAAKLERLKLTGQNDETPGEDDEASSSKNSKKVAKPIVIKNSSGKKRKIAAEVVIALGQRKGRKMVTVVTGLETFGIKLAYAAKICKKKFATGSTVTKAADNREVLEIQGSWQREFADMCHEQYGIPKNTIFVILPGKKKEKVRAFAS